MGVGRPCRPVHNDIVTPRHLQLFVTFFLLLSDQDLLDGFIKKFVLCPACDNPETTLNPNQKKQIITQRCKACGNSGLLDMRHKLTTFIMKNPPDAPLDGSEVIKSL